MQINKGFKHIKVKILSTIGNNIARDAYTFGRLSHERYDELESQYIEEHDDVKYLIEGILEGKTFPKFILEGHRIQVEIQGISRICLAQLTRDKGFFCSQTQVIRPLSQNITLPLSIVEDDSILSKVKHAQLLLEQAYIEALDKGVPTHEARYIGLHSQTISLTYSFTPAEFIRSCFSRTNSNFCDECNYVYRKIWWAVYMHRFTFTDSWSIKLWNYLFNQSKCISDGIYKRDRCFNSDFTAYMDETYKPEKAAINDWRKSGWLKELKRMLDDEPYLLTKKERVFLTHIKDVYEDDLPSTWDENIVKESLKYVRNKCRY